MFGKIFNIFLLMATAFLLTGCDAIYRKLHKEGAEEKELVGELTSLEKNVKVEEIQTLLKIYGYSPGQADGVLGTATRESIARFQKDNGLEQTRFVDQATWEKLKVFQDNGLVADGGINTKRVQEALKRAGFNPGKIDGVMGTQTIDAVKIFQREHELKMDGKIGYKTLTALSRYLVEEEPL